MNGETLPGPHDPSTSGELSSPSEPGAPSNLGALSELNEASNLGAHREIGAHAPAAAADPALDWRELVSQRRYAAARNAYLVSGEQDAGIRTALAALVDVQEMVRERSFEKGYQRIGRLDNPPDIVPWDSVAAELKALKASSAALDRRDPDAARVELEALSAHWFPAESLSQLGTSQIYDNDLEGAETSFTAAIELDPEHYRAITNFGNVLLEQGRVDEAIELYQRALKVDEEFPNAHHNLGVAYRRKGHLAKSVRSLRRAQKTQHRHDVVEARESISKWTGAGFAKALRWVIYGAIAVGVYFILRANGFI